MNIGYWVIRMCKPLRNKGIITDTQKYLLKWYYEDDTLYDDGYENKPVLFDGDYNAFDPDDKPLVGKYFDDEGNEVKQTHFSTESVKSALEWMIQIHEEKIEELIEEVEDVKLDLKIVGYKLMNQVSVGGLIDRIKQEYETAWATYF